MTNKLVLDNLSSITSGVDLTKVPPIHQKRLLTFVNHFIITTVSFLNNFAQTCERKLLYCDEKMQKLEAELCILEAKTSSDDCQLKYCLNIQTPLHLKKSQMETKYYVICVKYFLCFCAHLNQFLQLNSIPGLEEIQVEEKTQAEILSSPVTDESDKSLNKINNPVTLNPDDKEPTESESATPSAAKDPALTKFFKMVQFGVPVPAVKLKMQQEGFDPNLLDL